MVHGGTKWELGPEQALVIEFDEPVATYWSIQMYMLPWLTPLDAANRMTSIDDGQVRRDEDGKIRIVMAHCDPGVENWLDTSDLTEGLCSTTRWVRAGTEPAPVATLVDIAEVRKYLPESTPEFSSEARPAQIGKRHRRGGKTVPALASTSSRLPRPSSGLPYSSNVVSKSTVPPGVLGFQLNQGRDDPGQRAVDQQDRRVVRRTSAGGRPLEGHLPA